MTWEAASLAPEVMTTAPPSGPSILATLTTFQALSQLVTAMGENLQTMQPTKMPSPLEITQGALTMTETQANAGADQYSTEQ